MRWSIVLAGVLPLALAAPQAGLNFGHAVDDAAETVTAASATLQAGPSSVSSSAASESSTFEWPTAEGINTSTLLTNGTLITDPVRIAYLTTLHDQVIANMNNGTAVPMNQVRRISPDPPYIHKRQELVADFLGLFIDLILTEYTGEFVKLEAEIGKLFAGGNDAWWDDTDRCRVHFQTQGGAHELIEAYDRGATDPTSKTSQNIGWNDPKSTAPPVFYFDDPEVGMYSVQFTATDTVAWSGLTGTKKCIVQGLCNPQYVFYHTGYRIILNTWQSQGTAADCEYLEDCKGLCNSGVLNQFTTGGDVWGGDCAVPCYDETDNLPTVPDQAPKIMVVGDSISHGMQDDWTWRYRLYSWLTGLGYQATFVGPYVGTHGMSGLDSSEPMAPLLPGETSMTFNVQGGYAGGVSSDFTGSGHAAYWGRQATQDVPQINAWVDQYQPDYLLVLLGFNDLGWFVTGPDGLIGQMGELVENAREAKADVKLLIGNVVQRLFIEGRQDLVDNTNTYNQLLKDTLPSWFRWESPIAYVDVASYYDCGPDSCPDGYDGLHPAVSGEHHIAQAFADMLGNEFNFPGEPYVVPSALDGRPVSAPTNIKSYAYPEGIFTTWDNMPNNRGYEIRARLTGMTDWWSDGTVYPSTWGSWLSWLEAGQSWDTQVRTRGDFDVVSDWSDIVTVVANPATAPGPSVINTYPNLGPDIMTVNWEPVDGYDIHCYGVITWDLDTPDAFISTYATTGTEMTFTDLIVGHRYGVWVASYINLSKGSVSDFAVTPGGLPAAANAVIFGGGVPLAPASLSYTEVDATTMLFTWPETVNAAGYTLYMRNLITDFSVVGSTTDTTLTLGFLFPGVWNYEYCIGSYNGNYESSYGGSSCVTPPICCGYSYSAEHGAIVDAQGNVFNATANSTTSYPPPQVIANNTATPFVLTTGANATVTVPASVIAGNSTANVTLLTMDPRIGQLYSMYHQTLASLQQNNISISNLTFASPDTVVQLS